MKFKVKIIDDFVLVEFLLDQNITPDELGTISPPDLIKENLATRGVILSGRGPVWLFGFLIHFYHPTLFVATYDPRIGGAVVVQSHSKKYNAGDIIPLKIDELSNPL